MRCLRYAAPSGTVQAVPGGVLTKADMSFPRRRESIVRFKIELPNGFPAFAAMTVYIGVLPGYRNVAPSHVDR
jgi:hypothetical protein